MSEQTVNREGPAFTLPATDGSTVSLSDVMGENGVVVAFICNHCPYVVSAARRIVDDAKALAEEGVGFVAICSNDAERYPADSFERMKDFSSQFGFSFPYLHDESQAIAEAYGARVTPHFFGLGPDGTIHYEGRMDAGAQSAPPAGSPRELVDAMRTIKSTGAGPATQNPPAGCSIKWKP